MERYYLIDYLKQNNVIDKEIMDSIKCELDQYIYYYGSQFKYPKEYDHSRTIGLRDALIHIIMLIKMLACTESPKDGKKTIISNAYFNLNKELEKLGYSVYKPLWNVFMNDRLLGDVSMYLKYEEMKQIFKNGEFNQIISESVIDKIMSLRNKMKESFIKNKIDALIVPNDMSFFENISINIFKELNRKSIVFLHGLPGRYNNIDDNRADYLIVWGEKIRQNYIKAGVDENKIFVSGHPNYKCLRNSDLRFTFNDILIITKSANGAQQSDKKRLYDRGNLILYLYSIEKILNKIGIKHARLRLHPAENPEWYKKFINLKFYEFDKYSLEESLNRATLVIGPTSTVFLESIYNGVNYTIYEPESEELDLINYKIVPPFDGSDIKVPVAKNEEQLEQILISKSAVDKTLLKDYISVPFKIDFIKDLI